LITRKAVSIQILEDSTIENRKGNRYFVFCLNSTYGKYPSTSHHHLSVNLLSISDCQK